MKDTNFFLLLKQSLTHGWRRTIVIQKVRRTPFAKGILASAPPSRKVANAHADCQQTVLQIFHIVIDAGLHGSWKFINKKAPDRQMTRGLKNSKKYLLQCNLTQICIRTGDDFHILIHICSAGIIFN